MEIRKLMREEFPKLLLQIPDAPKQLYLKGNLPPEDAKVLCIVGSRNNTTYGKDVCQKFISSLAGKNVAVVSGLALGIDAIAHQAAMDAGLFTLAIPGSGIDERVLHPQSNLYLARRILESGGGILSEFEPMFKATHYSFPMRNRIMAGLSHAVLIIEAEIKSGTLITSRLATDYNRDVLTVPGSIYSKNTAGPHMLIRLGATPITKPEELFLALGFDEQMSLPNISQDDCSLRDELIRQSKLHASEANMYISLLEMKGHIKESMGEIRLV
jgi:DNA processing protein